MRTYTSTQTLAVAIVFAVLATGGLLFGSRLGGDVLTKPPSASTSVGTDDLG